MWTKLSTKITNKILNKIKNFPTYLMGFFWGMKPPTRIFLRLALSIVSHLPNSVASAFIFKHNRDFP